MSTLTQLVILIIIELRLVEFSDVHTHGRDVAIIERAVGRTNVGTVTGEGVAESVDRLIIPCEIVQLEPVGVTGRDGATNAL